MYSTLSKITLTPHQEQVANGAYDCLLHGQDATIAGLAGCLAADTIINVNRAKNGFKCTIQELESKFNGKPFKRRIVRNGIEYSQADRGWDLNTPTYCSRADGSVAKLGQIKNVWCSGSKFTYTLTTETGKSIRATSIHPFLTDNGWRQLGDLKVGDNVLVNVGQANGKQRQMKTHYPQTTTKYHPNQVKNCSKDNNFKVPTHRLVVEAALNGMGFGDFIETLRTDHTKCMALTFLERNKLVHHKNNDPFDYRLENLEVVDGQKEHAPYHQWENNVLFKIEAEQIVSIKPFGEEVTYDIEMCDSPHNFLANDFVVHNTGKSTVSQFLYDQMVSDGLRVCVLTPTWKAANVLRKKGVPATSIHRMIYLFRGQYESDDGEIELIFQDNMNGKFADFLFVDEASMVGQKIYDDIKSRGIPTLWIGDPGQLPPVRASRPKQIFGSENLFKLQEIHRQAKDSPIIRWAYALRNGESLTKPFYGINHIKIDGSLDQAVNALEGSGVDRTIVKEHIHRVKLNRGIRKHRGFTEILEPGDEIICCRNNLKLGVINGEIYKVLEILEDEEEVLTAEIQEEGADNSIVVPIWKEQFGNTQSVDLGDQWWRYTLFDYAYAVTCHKYQGSSSPHIGILAAGYASPIQCWNYTAATRAEISNTVIC